ncbi:lymphocyte-specific protein 1 isoform X2 [Spea bombifrons]|uniref:lymphocyte-specific protein 1 isoform X2 n=1 Tax=Spea bombifrons TaxID=233779 RepID=UPI00234B6AB2|nr:lymphocyte-specific protein 1 isoform X2 [Spea bombifrons]
MSTSLLRRNSSKKNLENLLRLTTQWSVEDEEEAARERRRRERERQEQTGNKGQAVENFTDETSSEDHVGLKPSGPWENEEDEGFSDWSQKLEQRRLQGACYVPRDEREEPKGVENQENGYLRNTQDEESQETRATGEEENEDAKVPNLKREEEEEEDEGTSRCEASELINEPDQYTHEQYSPEPCSQEVPISTKQWSRYPTREYEEDEEEKVEGRVPNATAQDDNADYDKTEERNTSWVSRPEIHTDLASDRCVREEENRRRHSVSSNGEECEGGITTTIKVSEMAENLSRTIEKSNSIKKSDPPLLVSKIDERLEQYTHAIEVSTKQPRLARQPSLELLSPAEPVSNKKNRWEIGEVATAAKPSPSKDTEGINIAVSDLISQWAKGKPDPDSHLSPTKPTEVKPGDVLNKKSLWEQGPTSGSVAKSSTASKKYKFVPIGHGKYEKVLVDEP